MTSSHMYVCWWSDCWQKSVSSEQMLQNKHAEKRLKTQTPSFLTYKLLHRVLNWSGSGLHAHIIFLNVIFHNPAFVRPHGGEVLIPEYLNTNYWLCADVGFGIQMFVCLWCLLKMQFVVHLLHRKGFLWSPWSLTQITDGVNNECLNVSAASFEMSPSPQRRHACQDTSETSVWLLRGS